MLTHLPLKRLLLSIAAVLSCLIFTQTASALDLSNSASSQVLYGENSDVTLTASNAVGQPNLYNVSFRDVLPKGISYVPGSAKFAGQSIDPSIYLDNTTGITTLIWSNVSDITPNASLSLTYSVKHDQTLFDVGSSYTHQSSVYANTDPRTLPKFTSAGVPSSGATHSGIASAPTSITAIKIRLSEPSPEGEIMRGVHNHQTIYTAKLTNNLVNPTTGTTTTMFLPAGLEFLDCGQMDNTTTAATSSSSREYAGASLLSGHVAAPADCQVPTSVDTVSVDPDGSGPMPLAIYTKVVYDSASFAAGQEKTLRFVAGIPIRENTMTGISAPATSLKHAANLGNNSGTETFDEQLLKTFGSISGTYKSSTVSNDHILDRTAEDERIVKSSNSSSIGVGNITRWTLTIDTSEYRFTKNIRVTDTVPNGLCPLEAGSSDLECMTTGNAPTHPYKTATENNNGTWTLDWDKTVYPQLDNVGPSATRVIEFSTKTREFYQTNLNNANPVLARDAWTNKVSMLGADDVICDTSASCVTGTPIAHDEANGIDDADVSESGQSAKAPQIDKTVRQPSASPVSCTTGSYTNALAKDYAPGDRICFKLRVDFPDNVHTGFAKVTDFLPVGTTYESSGSLATPNHLTANNTVNVVNFDSSQSGVLVWNLGSGNYADLGQTFEAIIAVRYTDPTSLKDADIQGNLMKFSFVNTPSVSFSLRDQVDYQTAEAQLQLKESIRRVNTGTINPAQPTAGFVDDALVKGQDVVSVRVDVSNTGSRDAKNSTVWEILPTQITCANIVSGSISNGGVCTNGRIVWTGLDVAAGQSKTLTFDYTVPATAQPSTIYNHHAGVRDYQSDNNTGGLFTYYPASNIDSGVLAASRNADAADDTTRVRTGTPTLALVATAPYVTGDSGNSSSQATIGEKVDYTATLVVPGGTILNGTPSSVLTIPIGTRQTYVAGSVSATFNGGSLPAGTQVDYTNGNVVLTFPAGYQVPQDQTFVVKFSTTVDDETANNRVTGSSIPTTATFAYNAGTSTTPTNLNASASVTLVEPNIQVAKSNNVSNVAIPGQTFRYTVTVSNPSTPGRVSGLYNSQVVDTLPANMTALTAGGLPVADGGLVGPDNGIWNAANRTITFSRTAILAVNATASFRYDVRIDEPAVAQTQFVNNVVTTTESMPSGGRTSAANEAGYRATATNTVRVKDLSLSKTASNPTPTIGNRETYTVNVTIPGGVSDYDVVVRDTLPNGMKYDDLVSSACVSGCPGNLSATELPAVENGDGTTSLAFFLGDITGNPYPQDRVFKIVYRAHVFSNYKDNSLVVKTNQLKNSAVVQGNRTDKLTNPTTIGGLGTFDNTTSPVVATVTVVEPTLTLDKKVNNVDSLSVAPETALSYTVKMTNTGASTAYDVVVADQPDVELVDVQTSSGLSTTTLTKNWSVGDRNIKWTIPSISAGASVTLSYTAKLAASSNLKESDVATNTASVTEYWGVPVADRTTDGFQYRRYTDVAPDTVNVNVDLPRLAVILTTNASGFPDSAPAEVLQPFTWRAVVSNTSPTADAFSTETKVVLPPNWTYKPGSVVGFAEPTIAPSPSGDVLTFATGTLVHGASKTVLFDAVPSLAAKTNPGVGSANPNIARASIVGKDGTGATGSQDGPYAAGPDPAQAILRTPVLTISKTPDNAVVNAGDNAVWKILVKNTGDGTARNVKIEDTLPSGVDYVTGSATAAPTTGFSETSRTGQSVVWKVVTLAPNAQVEISVPVKVDAGLDANTVLTNTAKTFADEVPTPVADTGSFKTVISSDVEVVKTGSLTPVTAGNTISWSLVVKNNGPSIAKNVKLTDQLPANTSFGSVSNGCSQANGLITCEWSSLAVGETKTIQVEATVDAGETAKVENTAKVTSTTPDPNLGNNESKAETTIKRVSDLEITKTADQSEVVKTYNANYTIKVKNNGPSKASNVVITDQVPSGMTFVSSDCAGGVNCQIGDLAVGESKTIHLVLRADAEGDPVNVATVSSTSEDSNPANNTSSAQVHVLPFASDISIVKKASLDIVGVGFDLDYKFFVTNNGPAPASGVVVKDVLPLELVWKTSPGCTFAGQVLNCVVGDLAVGESKTITVHAKAVDDKENVVNTATVSSSLPDTNPANNSSSDDVKIVKATTIKVEKKSNDKYIVAGSQEGFAIKVTNTGNADAYNVKVCDDPDSNWTFAKTPGMTIENGVACITIPKIKKGEFKIIRICLTLDPNAPGKSEAKNVATAVAANAGPKTDTATVKVTGSGGAPDRGQGELVPVTKTELQVDLEAGETKTIEISCPTGYYMTDGAIRVDHVDQGTGTLDSVYVYETVSTAPGTYRMKVKNTATGRAQAKAFGTCLAAKTVGQGHNLNLGEIVSKTIDVNGRAKADLVCPANSVPVSPGFVSSGQGRPFYSEPNGSGWTIGYDSIEPSTVTVSIRCLARQTSVVSGHTHALVFTHKETTVSVPAGQSTTAQVTCDQEAKGIVASYDIPNGVTLQGHDPQPKTRVFYLTNSTGQAVNIKLDLTCLGDRTGGPTKNQANGDCLCNNITFGSKVDAKGKKIKGYQKVNADGKKVTEAKAKAAAKRYVKKP